MIFRTSFVYDFLLGSRICMKAAEINTLRMFLWGRSMSYGNKKGSYGRDYGIK